MSFSSGTQQDEAMTPIAEALRPLSASLTKAKRLCMAIKTLIAIGASLFLICYAVVWVLLLVLSLQRGIEGTTMAALVGFLATGICGGVGAFLAYKIFDDLVRRDAIFTARQVKRLKVIALIFALLFVIELLLPSSSLIIDSGGMEVVGLVDDSASYIDTPKLNLGSLLFAAVFYCASAIFEYASLLQQASDETI